MILRIVAFYFNHKLSNIKHNAIETYIVWLSINVIKTESCDQQIMRLTNFKIRGTQVRCMLSNKTVCCMGQSDYIQSLFLFFFYEIFISNKNVRTICAIMLLNKCYEILGKNCFRIFYEKLQKFELNFSISEEKIV